MTDKPPHADDLTDGGLEAQLDALLAQIEAGQPATPPAPEDAGSPEPAEAEAAVSPDQPAGEEASPFTDELDAQLANLISAATEAVADEELPAAPPPPSAAPAASAAKAAPSAADADAAEVASWADAYETPQQTLQSQNDDLADQIQELLNEAKQQHEAQQAAAQDEPGGIREETGEVPIEQIDRMLADQADDAVSDAFESPQEVMSAPANAARDDAQAYAEDDTDAFASPEQVLAEPPQEDDTYASIEQMFAEQRAAARDQAMELDEQPEPAAPAAAQRPAPAQPKAPAAQPKPQAKAPASPPPEPAPKITLTTRMQAYGELSRRMCVTLNKPLERFPPEVRNTIGYVGLATLANAVFLMIYGLLF